MIKQDVDILKQINEASQMGVTGIDNIIDRAEDRDFKEKLNSVKDNYETYKNKARNMLKDCGSKAEDISEMSKVMSRVMSEAKTLTDKGNDHLADMMFQGVTMGIKTISSTLNENADASGNVKTFANEYLGYQYDVLKDISKYL